MAKKVDITEDERDLIMKHLRGQGGFQSLLQRLQGGIDGLSLSIQDDDVATAIRYFTEYGGGGFQQRLAGLVEKLRKLK